MSRQPPHQSTSSSSRDAATGGSRGGSNLPSAPYPPFPATQLSSARSSNLTASSPFTAAGMNLSMNASAAFARTSVAGGNTAATAFHREHSAGFGSSAAGESVSGASVATTVGESSSLDHRGRMTSSLPTLEDPTLLRKGSGNAASNRAFQQQQQMQIVSPKIQFCHWDVLATINCVQDVPMDADGPFGSPRNKAAAGVAGTTSSRPGTRKAGPVLLELQRIQFPRHRSGEDDEHEASLFSTSTLVQSRGNPSLGTSVASTCLDVASQLPSRHLSGMDATAAMSSSSSSNIDLSPCVTGLTTGAVCIHTFSPQLSLNETTTTSTTSDISDPAAADGIFVVPSIEYYHTTRSHRPATAVAWRPTQRHVAVGLTGTATVGGGGGGGGGDHRHHLAANAGSISGTSRRAQGTGGASTTAASGARVASSSATDRDFCCLVYDVEHQSSTSSSTPPTASSRRTKSAPIFKLSHQTGVASLAWLLEGGQTLAVGGQMRGQLQIYDLRVSGTNMNPPIAAYAHNYGIVGIEVDPHRPWQFVSFCQTASEPVKVWDVRRMDTNLTEIKVASGLTKGQSSGGDGTVLDSGAAVISAAKYSFLDPGMLFFALGDSILEYDASTGSRPIQVNSVHSQRPILDFALYPYPEYQDIPDIKDGSNKRVIAELFRNRIAIIEDDRTFKDMARRAIAPLAVSKRDGRLLHGLGRILWMNGSEEGPTAMESHELRPNEDISATMMRRARCSQTFRYSMDTISNIQLLGREIADMSTHTSVNDSGRSSSTNGPSQIRDALIRLWSWIQRVEDLVSEDDTGLESEYRWTSKGLIGTGAWRLLQMSGAGESEMQAFSEELFCTVYDSTDRRAALTSCGWAGRFELYDVLSQCEDIGDYERAAAIAVWNGDIGAGVESLQRGAEFVRSQVSSERSSRNPHITTEYAETLELAAISIAGFRGNDQESAHSNVWQKVCTGLLQRQDLAGGRISPTRTAYIRGAIRFLLSVGHDSHHQEILGDSNIALCDRVAFACRFLERSELKKFLEKYIEDGKVSGNVEALTITGIDKEGLKILQSYVDRYADVQTAALVTSRVIFPADWTEERRICAEWLGAYRSLLNTWEMWQSRAMFDVERADLLRKLKMRQLPTGSGAARRNVAVRRGGPRTPDPDIFAAIPSQLDARCNYCNAPLGLRNQDSTPNHWLAKLKPILSCCPQCRKPLPRCAICMLSLGTLNPYTELTKDRTRSGRGTPQLPLSDDASSLGNLPFAEWFTWCMRCKHGGHAHHMVGWFSKHAVCPVSGCDCRCQFDGMPKLKRPALLTNSYTEITTPKTE